MFDYLLPICIIVLVGTGGLTLCKEYSLVCTIVSCCIALTGLGLLCCVICVEGYLLFLVFAVPPSLGTFLD